MNIVINLIIVAFIINFIYRSMKQIEKQKKSQIESRKKIVYPKRSYRYNIPKTNKNVITKASNPILIKHDIEEDKLSVNTDKNYENTDKYENFEEYDIQMDTDMLSLNLVEGIIMSEVLAPPISKRGPFRYRRRK